jgi:hypothetical protein
MSAGLEQGPLREVELAPGDLVGAVAGHQAPQLVAAPDVVQVRRRRSAVHARGVRRWRR